MNARQVEEDSVTNAESEGRESRRNKQISHVT
jgi:hypothetical protein